MSGPGPRGAMRGLASAMLLVMQLLLALYTDVPDELAAALAGLYMAVWGVGEALYDHWAAQRAT